jgi:predicted DNA-binding transcriptional regulator YafY
LPENRPENKEIFLNIEELLRALSARRKVSFNYLRYEAGINKEKKANIVLGKDGNPRIYTVSPYEIVITNGHYYLICIHDQFDSLYHYRLNFLCNVKVLASEKRRPIRDIPGYRNGFKLAEYMKEHPYMMASGEIMQVKFRFNKFIIRHVYEWFGKDMHLMGETDETITAVVKVNEKAMLFWALQYGLHVEVLEPLSLRENILDAVVLMGEKYKKGTVKA